MRRARYILNLFLVYLLMTEAGKICFMYYNRTQCFFTLSEMWGALWHGLPMDLTMVSVLMFVPWLATVVTVWLRTMPLRFVLTPWFLLVAIVAGGITAGTDIMYEHWRFLLDASVFSYMSSPGNAASSASTWYIVSRISCAVMAMLLAFLVPLLVTPVRFSSHARRRSHSSGRGWMIWAQGLFLVICISALFRTGTRGSSFTTDKIFLNHGATNPVMRMVESMHKYSLPYDRQFRYMDDEQMESIMADMYPLDTEDVSDTLLRVKRPNVITIQLESYGAVFVEKLGGVRGVSPNLCRWMGRSINFTNAWSNSFRTDRGTVSALSGYPAYPTLSLMLMDEYLDKLPSLAHSLAANGYRAEYIYGGNSVHMNKRKYLEAAGFMHVWDINDLDVPAHERDIWGANDSISLQRLYDRVHGLDSIGGPWYMGYQTISSHEPFDVPYRRLENRITNAFAYSDHCVGRFLDMLSKSPLWENTIVVIFADHGYPYNQSYQDAEFFHMPLMITGGAIVSPRTVQTLINQSDIPATLLSQMGISHKDYPWSRNVFSRNYTYPFVYCNYPSGAMFADSTGVTITDLYAERVVTDIPEASGEERLTRLHAFMQATYGQIPEILTFKPRKQP